MVGGGGAKRGRSDSSTSTEHSAQRCNNGNAPPARADECRHRLGCRVCKEAADTELTLRRRLDDARADLEDANARRAEDKRRLAAAEKKASSRRANIDRLREGMKHTVSLKTHNAELKEAVDKERQAARAEKGAQLREQLDSAAKQFDEYETKVTAHAAAREEVKRLRNLCEMKQGKYDNAMGVLSDKQAEITRLKEEVQRLKTVAQVAANGEHIATVKRQMEAQYNTAKKGLEAEHKSQLSAHETTERRLHTALTESRQRASELLAEKQAACSQRDEASVHLESLQRLMDELNEQRGRKRTPQAHKASQAGGKEEHTLAENAAKLKLNAKEDSLTASMSSKATTAPVRDDATATSAGTGDNEQMMKKKKTKEALRLCCDNYERLCGIAHLLDTDARAHIESVSGTMAKVRLGLGMSGCARSHSRITMDDVVLIAQLLHVAATAALTWAPGTLLQQGHRAQQHSAAAGSRAAALHAHLDTLRQTAAGNNADCTTCLAQRSVVAALVHRLRGD